MRNKDSDVIVSDFDRDEKFTIENIPKDFESVTDASIKQLRKNTVDRVERITNFDPATLEVVLQNDVDAQFGIAYSVLEDDYRTRRSNLKKAYSEGFAELDKDFKEYKLEVVNHNTAFKNYSEDNKIINGEELPDSLKISDEEMEEISSAIKKINRRKYDN